MTRLTWLFAFGLVVSGISDDPNEVNPFYVDQTIVIIEKHKYRMQLKNHHQGGARADNPEIMHAAVTFESLDKYVLRFKMTDANQDRWEVKFLNPNIGKDYVKSPINEMGLQYNNDPFTFTITDPRTNELFVSTQRETNSSLKFYDKYVEFGAWYPNQRIFGLGERVTPTFALKCMRLLLLFTAYLNYAQNDNGADIQPLILMNLHLSIMEIHPAGSKFMEIK